MNAEVTPTEAVEARKQREREFHDEWRGHDQSSPSQANGRFYTIGRTCHAYTSGWLRDRCRQRKVLEYCCGDGKSALFAAEQGAAEAHGIDISPISIEQADYQARLRGLAHATTFSVMDAEATSYPDGYFDVIVVSGVLHHLDLDRAYRELSRLLTTDG
jgi:ubiquinone/menaquinone biosynthesis C-methylase UbiE